MQCAQRGSESARWNLARAALIALAAASAPGRSGAAPPPSAAPPPCAVGDGATTLGLVPLSTLSADAPGSPPTLALRWLHIPKCGQSFATTLYWFGCRRVVRCFPHIWSVDAITISVGIRCKNEQCRCSPAVARAAAGFLSTSDAAGKVIDAEARRGAPRAAFFFFHTPPAQWTTTRRICTSPPIA